MAELKLELTITLETHRCYECGRWYACEAGWLGRSTCPYCAERHADALRAERDGAQRVARSLRGALTRRKRRG